MRALVVLALLATAALASTVVVLTPENFDAVVLDASKDVFVKFYAP